jgi:DNA-binding NarL/FixJ family response regulator
MTEGDRVVRVLIADGHSVFREGLKRALDGEVDLEVVADAGDGADAVAEAARTIPHVAILDSNLPKGGGMKAAAAIRDQVPSCRTLILCGEEDHQALTAAVEAGAAAFLIKEAPLEDVIHAARAAHRGETLLPPKMLGRLLVRLMDRRTGRADALRLMFKLTAREREVLYLLIDGADNEAIARVLFISPQTARTHIQNILTKLSVHSRLEAVSFVLQNGILEELAEAA